MRTTIAPFHRSVRLDTRGSVVSEHALLAVAIGLLGLGGLQALGSGFGSAIAGDAQGGAQRAAGSSATRAPMATSQQAAINFEQLLRAGRLPTTADFAGAVHDVTVAGKALDLGPFKEAEAGRFAHAALRELEPHLAALPSDAPGRASVASAMTAGMIGETPTSLRSWSSVHRGVGNDAKVAHLGVQFALRFSTDSHSLLRELVSDLFPGVDFSEMEYLQPTSSRAGAPGAGLTPPPYSPVDVAANAAKARAERALVPLAENPFWFPESVVESIRESVMWPFDNPEDFAHGAPKGVLVSGPKGSGKTHLSEQLATRLAGDAVRVIRGPEVVSKWLGATEEHLRELVAWANGLAEQGQPAAIVLDAMDSFVHVASSTSMDYVHSVATQMEAAFKALHPNAIVIASVSDLSRVPPSLRQGGRFDVEVKLRMPTEKARRAVLEQLVAKLNVADDVSVEALVESTSGYNMGDLEAVMRKAEQNAVKDLVAAGKTPSDGGIVVTRANVDAAVRSVVSLLKENSIQFNPNIKFADVGGMAEQIQTLKDKVVLRLERPELFKKFGVEDPQPLGVALYGPPGTGKTLLANAVANEAGANAVAVSASELQSAADVRKLFQRCRDLSPCLLFLDEGDARLRKRGTSVMSDEVVSTILEELDGFGDDDDARIAMIVATNRLGEIDPAILRPNRVGVKVFVGMPDAAQRRRILTVRAKKMPIAEELLDLIAQKTDGFNGADLKQVLEDSVEYMVKTDPDADAISPAAVESVLATAKPSVSAEAIREYEVVNNPASRRIGSRQD